MLLTLALCLLGTALSPRAYAQPAPPTGLIATTGDGVGSGSVALDWDANGESNLAGYNLYRHTASFTDTSEATRINGEDLLLDPYYFDGGLDDNTTYYYRVVAVDENGNPSDTSDEVSASPSPDTAPPAAPTNLTASAGDSQVELTWDPNDEFDLYGYNVYRHTETFTDTTAATRVNGDPVVEDVSYLDTDVSNGTTYYYRVVAVDIFLNQSDISAEVDAAPADAPPAIPMGLTATAGDTQVTLEWESNDEADMDAYEVHRSETSSFTPDDGTTLVASVNHTGSGESYTDTGLSNGTTYYYKVIAVDAGGNESDSSSEVGTTPATDNTAPVAPALLLVADWQTGAPSGDAEAQLGWINSTTSDVAGYNLYRSTSSFSSTDEAGVSKVNGSLIPATQTTYIDDGVTNDTEYFYRVTAEDGSGNESDPSNEVATTSMADLGDGVPPAPPTGLEARAGDGEVVVGWMENDEQDLRGYNLYRDTSPISDISGMTPVNGSTPISRAAMTYVDDGASNGQTYYYALTAVDYDGNETSATTDDSYGNTVTATPSADAAGAASDFVTWLPDRSSWSSDHTGGAASFMQDTRLHYVYNGTDGTNRPFDVTAYDNGGIGIYTMAFTDPGEKGVQGGPNDPAPQTMLAGFTEDTSMDTDYNTEFTLTFEVDDESDPNNEIAYMIVTGEVVSIQYDDVDAQPDTLTLTVKPVSYANTPGNFAGEGGLYLDIFNKNFQFNSDLNAVFANNVYATDVETEADLSALSDMAGIKVTGTNGERVDLKFFFNAEGANTAWGIADASNIGGYRETGTGTGEFESITASASVDNSNFDLNFDGAVDDTYVVDLSNDQWSTRFVTAGASGGGVPVELTSFDGVTDDTGVTLRWETASETNNAGFEVERRVGGGLFEQIGYVEGHGTTTSPQSYRFTDTNLPAASGTFTYRLKQIDLDGSFEYSPEVELSVGLPDRFALQAPYPNPFTNTASIRYALPRASHVRLSVYNVLGQRVATLVEGEQSAGRRTVKFNPQDLSSGVYFIRMQAGNFTATQRVTLAR